MRDFAIVLVVFGSVPLILLRPQIGILMWFWLSLMNPHRLTWGYAQELRVALIVGLATLVAWLMSREPKQPPKSSVVVLLAALTFWMTVAAALAIHPDVSIPKWEEDFKILLMTFVTICIVQSRDRINQLVWVVIVSIGWYGFKGGLFTILTGGEYRVWGPPSTFIEDNNDLACALIMVLPFMEYLRIITHSRWVRLGLAVGMGLTIFAVLGTYSRGGLLGLSVMLAFLAVKSGRRIAALFICLGVVGIAIIFLPQSWYERMDTIENYQNDESVQGRFDAWTFNFRLALDHPFAGGGQIVGTDDSLFHHYVPTAPFARAAHSIYFEVLGETGFVGLGIYLSLLVACYQSGNRIIRLSRGQPHLEWARSLAKMTQASLVGYSVGGAFLSLGFFDLYFAIVALVAVTEYVVRQQLAKPATSEVEGESNAGGRSSPLLPVRLPT